MGPDPGKGEPKGETRVVSQPAGSSGGDCKGSREERGES